MSDSTSSDSKHKILVVEDYDEIRQMMVEILSAKGYEVTEAETGTEAVTRAAEANPDLILMDLTLPEQDGVESIRQIRQSSERLASVPIFVASGYMIASVREEVRQAGGASNIELFDKPLDMQHLLERIQLRLETQSEAGTQGDENRAATGQ